MFMIDRLTRDITKKSILQTDDPLNKKQLSQREKSIKCIQIYGRGRLGESCDFIAF